MLTQQEILQEQLSRQETFPLGRIVYPTSAVVNLIAGRASALRIGKFIEAFRTKNRTALGMAAGYVFDNRFLGAVLAGETVWSGGSSAGAASDKAADQLAAYLCLVYPAKVAAYDQSGPAITGATASGEYAKQVEAAYIDLNAPVQLTWSQKFDGMEKAMANQVNNRPFEYPVHDSAGDYPPAVWFAASAFWLAFAYKEIAKAENMELLGYLKSRTLFYYFWDRALEIPIYETAAGEITCRKTSDCGSKSYGCDSPDEVETGFCWVAGQGDPQNNLWILPPRTDASDELPDDGGLLPDAGGGGTSSGSAAQTAEKTNILPWIIGGAALLWFLSRPRK